MPLYIDIHDAPGITSDAAARAHLLDEHVQAKHDVEYLKYWLNESQGKVFCLCHAPSADAADAVHVEAHGNRAGRIMEVTPEIAQAFMGAAETNKNGAVVLPNGVELDPGTRTVLFTDMVDSTATTQRIGDDAAFALLEAHNRIVRAALESNHGREVKHTGDGIMAAFASAVAATRCAMAVQEALLQYRAEHSDLPLRVRVGIAAGEPIEHHNDFFGATVQLAARLCAHAQPDQIVVSNAVAELCTGKALPFSDLGMVSLKGFGDAVHAHCITCGT